MSSGGELIGARVDLKRLTSLRFFAALLVVLNHVTRDLAHVPVVSQFATMGTTGVGFFFALSGFVLTWSLRDNDTPARFYRRRFARVYPMHLLTFLISIPVLLWLGLSITPAEAGTNIVLLQGWIPDPNVFFGMNSPSWSLSCEMLFYALFPFCIPFIVRLRQAGAIRLLFGLLVAGVVVAIAVTFLVHDGDTAKYFLYIFPPFRLIGFLAGCTLGHLMKLGLRFNFPIWVAVVTAGVLFVAVFGVEKFAGNFGHGVEDAILLPAVCFVILVAASADMADKPGILRHRYLVRLGEWSFSLYLTHWLLLEVFAQLFQGVDDQNNVVRVAADVLFICLAVTVSWVAYRWVEKPLEKRLRGSVQRPAMIDAALQPK